MLIRFTKMHSLGNDFVVLDCINQSLDLTSSQIRLLADRHRGIGFDQLLMAESSAQPGIDFRYRIYNADGTEVEQCGNGARCFAKFVYDKKLTHKRQLSVETLGGVLELNLQDDNQIMVAIGAPCFEPAKIPFQANAMADSYTLSVNNQPVELGVLAIGNPHAVLVVDNIKTASVDTLGPALESHTCFPKRVNVGFMQIVNRNTIKLRVFERGAGETQACGSGACAAAVIGIARGMLDNNVTVELTGGTLQISWAGKGESIKMTGPATTVFEGKIII